MYLQILMEVPDPIGVSYLPVTTDAQWVQWETLSLQGIKGKQLMLSHQFEWDFKVHNLFLYFMGIWQSCESTQYTQYSPSLWLLNKWECKWLCADFQPISQSQQIVIKTIIT